MCSPRFSALALLALTFACVAGCSDEPRAPPLVNEAMYQNAEVGLRFLAPTGWPMTSRSVLPPGPLPQPIRVVNYVATRGDSPADFSLVVANATPDVARLVKEFRYGPDEWQLVGKPEAVKLGNRDATRYTFSRAEGGQTIMREVTAIPQAGRMVLFYATHGARDRDNRDACRSSLESLEWTK